MKSSVKTELWRTVKFALFSISAGAIQILCDVLLNEICGFVPWLSYLIALIVSVIWNFTFVRKFAFHSDNNVPVALSKVFLFYLIFTPLSTWWTAALTEPSYGIMWNEYVVLILTMLSNFTLEFLYDRFVVFAGSIDATVKDK